MFNKYFCLLVLLFANFVQAADPIDDIKNWRTGLPIVAHWNTGGHNPDWHVAQIKAGARMIPTVKIDVVTQFSKDKNTGAYLGAVPKMSDDSRSFLQTNKLPISIRTDNIGTVAVQWPRAAKDISSLPLSAVPFGLNSDGTIDDKGVPDYFADPNLWRQFGLMWVSSKYMRDIQVMFPDVPYFVFADNNEVNQKVTDYLTDWLDASGKTAVDQYGNLIKTYRTGMPALSLRFADYTKDHDVNESITEFYRRKLILYQTLFSSFNEGLTAWKGKMLTECYSGVSSNGTGGEISWTPYYSHARAIFDGGGPPAYVKGDSLWNFTSSDWFRFSHTIPAFEQAERNSPDKEFRELFLTVTAEGVTKGKIAGLHENITPELHKSNILWLLWSTKGVRVPYMLRYWTSNADKPTDVIFAPYTKQDYFDASVSAVNSICDNPTLRDFWLNGEPVVTGTHPQNEIRTNLNSVPVIYPKPEDPDARWRLLDVDLNTPRNQFVIQPGTNNRGGYNPQISIKVWGTAIKLNDRYLVYLWTPCLISGECKFTVPGIGEFTVPVPQPASYTIVERGDWKARKL